jgi:hypothetical protein
MQSYTKALQIARAYVPFQTSGETFRPECALTRGTAFPELYQPYIKECKE